MTHHAIEVIEGRMRVRCPDAAYEVTGRPEDLGAARDLAERNAYEFQWWVNWLIGVQNYREHKKGPDKGIDGIIYFRNGPRGIGQIIVSVKSGNTGAPDADALIGTVQREQAEMGVLICFEPTRGMLHNAGRVGHVNTAQGRFQKIQVVTVEDLLSGKQPPMPKPLETEAFRQPLRPARRVSVAPPSDQLSLALPIPGRKGKRVDVSEHLAGSILAKTGRG